MLLTQDLFSLFGGSILMQSSHIQLPQLAAFTKHSLPILVLILQFTLRVIPDFVFLCSPPVPPSFVFILLFLFYFFSLLTFPLLSPHYIKTLWQVLWAQCVHSPLYCPNLIPQIFPPYSSAHSSHGLYSHTLSMCQALHWLLHVGNNILVLKSQESV